MVKILLCLLVGLLVEKLEKKPEPGLRWGTGYWVRFSSDGWWRTYEAKSGRLVQSSRPMTTRPMIGDKTITDGEFLLR